MWRGFISIPQAAETEAARREGVKKRDRKKDHSLSLLTRPGLSPQRRARLCPAPAPPGSRSGRPRRDTNTREPPGPAGRARRARAALPGPEGPGPRNIGPFPPKARAGLREPSWGPGRGAGPGVTSLAGRARPAAVTGTRRSPGCRWRRCYAGGRCCWKGWGVWRRRFPLRGLFEPWPSHGTSACETQSAATQGQGTRGHGERRRQGTGGEWKTIP